MHVFEDEHFEALQEIANKLLARDTPMSMIEQLTLAAALLFLLDKATTAVAPTAPNREIDDATALVLKDASATFQSLLVHLSNEVGGIVMAKVNGVPWFFADELAPELCGFIPTFLEHDDERPIREQINERYIGGWRKFEGFKLKQTSWTIGYSNDPDMQPLGGTALRGEVLAVYPYGWTLIVNAKTLDYEIARLD